MSKSEWSVYYSNRFWRLSEIPKIIVSVFCNISLQWQFCTLWRFHEKKYFKKINKHVFFSEKSLHPIDCHVNSREVCPPKRCLQCEKSYGSKDISTFDCLGNCSICQFCTRRYKNLIPECQYCTGKKHAFKNNMI